MQTSTPEARRPPDPAVERLGIFGGTFDPPHLGHLIVASEAKWACRFDELLVMVAHDPWQKRNSRPVSAASIRLEMVRRAFDGADGITPSSLEIDRGGASYSIDTALQLRDLYPRAELVLVLGRDSVNGLDSWHRAEELAGLVSICCVERPGTAVNRSFRFPWRMQAVDVPLIDLSSTEVRKRCGEGRPTRFLVPDAVRSFIAEHGLYGDPR